MLQGWVGNDSLDDQNFISHWDHFLQNSCINRQTALWPLNGKPVISVNDGLSQGYTACSGSVCQSRAQHRRFHADRLCCGFVFPGQPTMRSTACLYSKTVVNLGLYCLSARECEPQVLHNNTAADAQSLSSVTHSP